MVATLAARRGPGTRMSSSVCNARSGPALVATTSSAPHSSTYGVPRIAQTRRGVHREAPAVSRASGSRALGMLDEVRLRGGATLVAGESRGLEALAVEDRRDADRDGRRQQTDEGDDDDELDEREPTRSGNRAAGRADGDRGDRGHRRGPFATSTRAPPSLFPTSWQGAEDLGSLSRATPAPVRRQGDPSEMPRFSYSRDGPAPAHARP